jgi:hypothetical protein
MRSKVLLARQGEANMAGVAVGAGILLVVVGAVGYGLAEKPSFTALIPAAVGALFVVLGALARNEAYRKHAMHAAAGLGLLGAIVAGTRAVPGLMKLSSGDESVNRLAVGTTTAMMVICAVFVLLCIQSFIAARRSRAA